MENKIHSLPKDLINKIAAGEVIERPASIVKELIENSIDAGASSINISLEKGGLENITISDNGFGMNKFEVEESFKQHTTSKIKTYEDLFNITTLGFRGEALASISSIAKVSVHTFNGIDNPVKFSIFDKEISNTIGQGRSIGTTMIVSNIFQNIPVRRKFLKSEDTEYKYIIETFINIALSKPSINFSLVKNGRTVYKLTETNSLKTRILDIFKTIKDEELIPISLDNGTMQLNGLLGHPRIARTIHSYQYLFINSRFIKNPLINKAIREGYSTSIMNGTNPFYFLFINIKPSELDVNVHPRKLEVRFNNPNMIYSNTKYSISKTLESYSKEKFQSYFKEDQHKTIDDDTFGSSITEDTNKSIWSPLNTNTKQPFSSYKTDSTRSIKAGLEFSKNILKDTEIISQDLLIDKPEELISDFLQIFNTYIVLEKEGKILMIDQHAAHERINFEKLISIISNDKNITSQSLLLPININIDNLTKEKLFTNKKFINQLGFHFSLSSDSITINEIPNILPIERIQDIFKDIIEELETTEGQGSDAWDLVQNKVISTMACHSSIRAGQKLDKYVISQLIKDLFKCKLPYSCPHGRPFYIEIPQKDLEKQFKRIV